MSRLEAWVRKHVLHSCAIHGILAALRSAFSAGGVACSAPNRWFSLVGLRSASAPCKDRERLRTRDFHEQETSSNVDLKPDYSS